MTHMLFPYISLNCTVRRNEMTPDKIALLLYIAGSLCFLGGSLVLLFK